MNEETLSRCASHSIFTIVPEPDRMTETVEIKTDFLRNLVANAIAEADAAEQIHFYHVTSKHPWFRQSSGYVFQKFVITWLFSSLASEGLPCTPKDAATSEAFTLNPVAEDTLFVFGGKNALLKARNHTTSGWLPPDPNFPSFDAIIFTPKRIVTIQATIASTHDAKLGGFTYVEDVYKPTGHYRRGRKWCHVFVTHREESAAMLRNQKLSEVEDKGIDIYSAVLNPAGLGLTPAALSDAQSKRVCEMSVLSTLALPNPSSGQARPYRR